LNPSVNTEANKEIQLPINTTTLSASASDSDGEITHYFWKKLSGPSSVMNKGNTDTLELSSLVAGVYQFQVTVTDNEGAVSSDQVTLTVKAALLQNKTPTVNAGSDITITLPINQVQLSASAQDVDGSITSYNWKKISGGSANISQSNAKNTTITNLSEGQYVFEVEVSDNDNAKGKDTVKVIVNAEIVEPNQKPVVNAGADKQLTLPDNSLTIAAFASDTDGSIASYSWSKKSGPSASLTNLNTSNLTINNLLVGTYIFEVIVTDNDGDTAKDQISLIVNPEVIANSSPLLNLLSSLSLIEGESKEVEITASDVDGDELTLEFANALPNFIDLEQTSDSSWTLKINPSEGENGDYTLSAKVNDGFDDSEIKQLAIAVKKKIIETPVGHEMCLIESCNYIVNPPADTSKGPWTNIIGYNINPGDRICIMSGDYFTITLRGVQGTKQQPVELINCGGKVRVGVDNTNKAGIAFWANNGVAPKHIKLTGSGHPDHKYGFEILAGGPQGVAITGKPQFIEVEYLDIHSSGFAGIMAKDDPKCDDKNREIEDTVQEGLYIHHNYIHDLVGEGLYIGNSFYLGNDNYCAGKTVWPLPLKDIKIYENLIENTGWDGIQVGSAIAGVDVHHNTIIRAGLAEKNAHTNSIQIGEGSTGNYHHNLIIDAKRGWHDAGGSDKDFATKELYASGEPTNIYENVMVGANKGMYINMRIRGEHRIYNNTFVNVKGDIIHAYNPDNKDPFIVKDNIFHNLETDAKFYYKQSIHDVVQYDGNIETKDINSIMFEDINNNNHKLLPSSPYYQLKGALSEQVGRREE
jgi:hypothetical protein